MTTTASTDAMAVLDSPRAMRAWSAAHRAGGDRVALVPTMGALHPGHLALIDEAHRRAGVVVVSIFVNPLQFNVRDDFDRYPRDIDDDLVACAAGGVDAVYAPTQQTMYPPEFETRVVPGALADPLEGAGRPGHFGGVTTVVAKLFNAVRPDVAVFGEKDYQQLAIVRRMVDDLDMGIDIVGLATVREHDGLAMSSRNRRLDPAQRAAANVVPAALGAVEQAWATGATTEGACQRGADVIASEPLARLEYLEMVCPRTLQPITDDARQALATIAVWFGDVRLIDNRLLVPSRE
jgi:pantoate--beta-alanine ligase